MNKAFLAASAIALLTSPLLADEPNDAAGEAERQIERIASLDDAGPMLNAVIVYEPEAPNYANEASEAGTPLAGRTVLVKDNIETFEWPTSAGSLALKDNVTGRDAPLVARIRENGGVIMGKTNLSEWANIRAAQSTSGWSAIGGLTRNPHATDRNTCGSSSGSGAAIAAGFAWAAIGTETNGSITCPASVNGIVGFKPTVGMVSRTHIVPISASQDTAGPMTTSVHDAALLLSAIAGSDPLDPATTEADAHKTDFTAGLDEYSLQGVRIGVLKRQSGSHAGVLALLDTALEDLERAGAILVPIDEDVEKGLWPAQGLVLLYELQRDLNAYLATLPDDAMPDTLADIVEFNYANGDSELRWFGQDLFEQALNTTDEEQYQQALVAMQTAARADGIDRLQKQYEVAFLIAPTTGPAWMTDLVNGDNFTPGIGAGSLPAIAGYPHLTVPMGAVEGLPVGLSFIAGKWQDHEVLKAGAAYERARTAKLPAPSFKPWQPKE